MSTKIGIVNVNDFNGIPDAVIEAIKLIEKDIHFDFTKSENILLKPNLLTTKRDACTQPGFIEGVLAYLKNHGVSMNNVYIGDSPGQSQKLGSDVAKEIGIYEICESNGANFIDFESSAPVIENIDGALRLKEIHVAKAVKDCDILINLPRLKSQVPPLYGFPAHPCERHRKSLMQRPAGNWCGRSRRKTQLPRCLYGWPVYPE